MTNQTWTIGKNSTCDIVVENVIVSGIHCRLTQHGTKFTLEDLGSTNGTYLNGQRINGVHDVTRNDRITLGLTFKMPWPELDMVPIPFAKPVTNQVKRKNAKYITIGRAAINDLVLDETNISYLHAQLAVSDDEIVFEDLGSTNGISVGNVENKVNRAVVRPGDTIFLGSSSYRVSELLARLNDAAEPVERTTQAAKDVPDQQPLEPAGSTTGCAAPKSTSNFWSDLMDGFGRLFNRATGRR